MIAFFARNAGQAKQKERRMKITLIKMALNMVLGFLRTMAPMTSTKVDDKIVREFDRIKKQVTDVLS